MADNPWRCSECGTINEPVANSCRTCGKWPSLFDLEDNAIDEADFDQVPEPEPVQTYDAPEPITVEVETFEEPATEPEATAPRRGRFGPPTTEPVLEEGESSRPRWVSWLIPAAVVAYFVISYFFSGR